MISTICFRQAWCFGRLLLTVYVQWRTGLLVSSDWLRAVTRGGWRAGFLDRGHISADVN